MKQTFKETFRRMRKNKAAMIGLVIIVVILLIAIFADVISPYEYGIRQNSKVRLQPPSSEHIFGTDGNGRDVFTRVIHGARTSLTLGLATTLVSAVLGGVLGACAAYYGGKLDNIIMRLLDVIMCIPSMLLALSIVAALGSGMSNLLIAITISNIPVFARIIRSVVISIVENDYVEAAKACGTGDWRIIHRHILRNAMGPIVIQATMSISKMILLSASLSFLGMGVQPPAPEWGTMLSEAREFMRRAPYLMIFPGTAIVLSVLSLNLVGDGLRDALDPRLKR